MGDGVKCPSMQWGTGDDHTALQEFMSRLNRWFVIKDIQKTTQHNYIIFQAGEKGEELSKTWTLSAEDLKDPDKVWKAFDQAVGAADNFRVNRLNLTNYRQRDGESIDEFYVRCRILALKCKFSNVDERLLDQIIVGTRCNESRKELLKKDETLKIEDALISCRTYEASEEHMKAFEKSAPAVPIDAVHRKAEDKRRYIKECLYCGQDHAYGRCPAYNSECGYCKKKGHWQQCCLLKKKDSTQGAIPKRSREPDQRNKPKPYRGGNPETGGKRAVHSIDENGTPEDTLSFDAIGSQTRGKAEPVDGDIMVSVGVSLPDDDRNMKMYCKIDTGAQGNILPWRTYKNMCSHLLDGDQPRYGGIVYKCPSIRLEAYNGTEIPQLGCIELRIRHKDGPWLSSKFYIARSEGPIIIGRRTSQQLGIITVNIADVTLAVSQVPGENSQLDKNILLELYPDRFEGIGKFPGKCHIDLTPGAKAVIQPPRKYPIHLRDEIQRTLDDMIKLNVIEPIPETETTEWLNALAFSRKDNGKLRVCLDPRDLNAAIRRTFHRAPTVEEITHKLSGAKVFSKLDAKHGFWSIELDAQSSSLTAFSAPSGRYRFKRLPFGLKMAQDVFQEKMDLILAGCTGIISIADDIVVFGKDTTEHDKNLHNLMKRARSQGLVFNPDKCSINTDNVDFFGMTYTADGVKPDNKKTQEIADLPSPTDVRRLQQFLGMVQYMAPFLPNLSANTQPLRELIKKDTEWTWTPSHEKIFCKIKNDICQSVTLNYFDPHLQTKVQVDASGKGLGAALIQIDNSGKERIIAFASKALTQTEERYANIEREMLAVVFGVERFHTYLYGSKFIVESDHKPLEAIQLKHLHQAPPRLQRMLLRIQAYDLTIRYKPGKDLLLADTLSRLNPQKEDTIKLDKTIHSVRWSDNKISELQKLTDHDPELKPLCELIVKGWPEKPQNLPKSIRPYWSMKDFLTVEDGIIMKGSRIVVPEKMRGEILDRLHASHQGVEKTRLRARTCVYWRNIDRDIEELTAKCPVCFEFAQREQKETMICHDIPSGPWQSVGTDLFELHGQHYLIVADYYSKMPFIRRITSESSKMIIGKLKTLFGEHGVPEVVYSDGGPCFNSQEFAKFASDWNFRHVMSSPHYPQSNGFIERTIQTVKIIMKKAAKTHVDPEMALLCARATPVDGRIGSPGEILYGRTLRSNLPMKIRGSEQVSEELEQRQIRQQHYYNKGAKDLAELQIGQTVGLQDTKTLRWKKACVIDKQDPRSYVVQTEDGTTLRRNRRFLKDLLPHSVTTSLPYCSSTCPSSDSSTADTGDQSTTHESDDANNSTTPQTPARTWTRARAVRPPQRLIESME